MPTSDDEIYQRLSAVMRPHLPGEKYDDFFAHYELEEYARRMFGKVEGPLFGGDRVEAGALLLMLGGWLRGLEWMDDPDHRAELAQILRDRRPVWWE